VACADIAIVFGHVTALNDTLFGPLDGFAQWELEEESAEGGTTWRQWRRVYDLPVAAGERLGRGGGHVDQWGVDMGLFDLSRPPATMASPLWDGDWYLYAHCPLEYFVEPVRSQLRARLALPAEVLNTDYGCGVLHEDIAGALQGVWFPAEDASMYAEDRDVSFSHLSTDPRRSIIAIGGRACATVPPQVYFIETQESGQLNRPFDQVTSDGQTYAYRATWPEEPLILVRLVAPDTLWVEGLPAGTPQEAWSFSGARSVFIR